jgi:hypothetical protein
MAMKKPGSRRTFFKKIGISTLGAGVLHIALLDPGDANAVGRKASPLQSSNKRAGRPYNAAYGGEHLNRVAFPIGGLGAGMFCLEGTGAISHMSVRHQPEIFHEPGMFGAIAMKGEHAVAKVLEGPSPEWKRFGQPNSGNGSGGTIFGLPRFDKATFLARFPFGHVTLENSDLSLKAEIKGWNPFIPTDEDNSGLPVGALEYKIINAGNETAECVFSFHAKNFMKRDGGVNAIRKFQNGFLLTNDGTNEKPFLTANFAVFSDRDNTVVDHCWFRGGWFDPLTMTWETIRSATVKGVDPVDSGAPGASLYIPFQLAAGEETIIRIMTAWYVPDTDVRFGEDGTETEKCDPASGCCSTSAELGAIVADSAYVAGKYKPWYSNNQILALDECRNTRRDQSYRELYAIA